MPLRGGGPILQAAAARGSVAPQLARDRRRRPPQPAGDLAHPVALRAPQRDLLPFRERQIPPRQRLRRWRNRWGHAARLPEPACPHRRRHPRRERRVLTRQPRRNRRPEPPPVLTPRHPWPARRPQHASPCTDPSAACRAHRNPSVMVLRRPLESTLHAAVGVVDEGADVLAVVARGSTGPCSGRPGPGRCAARCETCQPTTRRLKTSSTKRSTPSRRTSGRT